MQKEAVTAVSLGWELYSPEPGRLATALWKPVVIQMKSKEYSPGFFFATVD